jgi:hypothetical protein
MEKLIKCAPGKKCTFGSCIELDTLHEMATAYNKYMADNGGTDFIKQSNKLNMLKPDIYKKYLLYQFKKRFYSKCKDDQLCWLKHPFIAYMDEKKQDDILFTTFRPPGPNGRFEWLNTMHIELVMLQYMKVHPEFIFLGAVPIDFEDIGSLAKPEYDLDTLYKNNKIKIGIIFNLDEHYLSGSHWVAAYSNMQTGEIYYYDSNGIRPEPRIRKFLIKILHYYKKKLRNPNIVALYNEHRHQYANSECGMYSINFIINLLHGKSFHDIVNNNFLDEEANRTRQHFFNVKWNIDNKK